MLQTGICTQPDLTTTALITMASACDCSLASSSKELGKVSWRNPNCVRNADVRQLTRGAEFVDRSRADAEALGYLAHRQQLLGKLHVPRGHRGDKSSLVGRGIDSIRCIGSLDALNDVECLRPSATRCQPSRALRIGLGCKWSLVQIQSPRPVWGRDFIGMIQ